ncbi:unnamed protein product [Orchesella dallaii]|uniref:HTH CENPB-type domain-containing protein n=1 Tax=Orchesella dallaii TaxID=48710 RepID=A0ABP1REK1_9HEXA
MEINPVSVVTAVLDRVKAEFIGFDTSPPTEKDIIIAKKLYKSFHAILTDAVFAETTTLEEDPYSEPSSLESVYDEDGSAVVPNYNDNCSLERKKQILKLIREHPRWDIKTLQRNGAKEYKHTYYRKRWEDQVRRGGTRYEKLKFIDEYTYERFTEARNDFKCIKESNLHSWAIQASQTFQDDTFAFKASHSWVDSFKKKHGITSRRITKLVTRREILSMDAIHESAKAFQLGIKSDARNFQPDNIINTDQAGFTYEITNNRTLSHRGEKSTWALAKSPTNLATHSYTVQYVVSMAGKIVGDVFICLQERSGRLGPQVQNDLCFARNVTLTCSTSGKLTTSLYEYFLDKVVVQSMQNDFMFILDSWGGQTNVTSYSSRFGINGTPNCALKVIPKRCTSICQPLDTTFHRQLKYFARCLSSEFILNYCNDINPVDEITTRVNIVKMHSLIHNQLSAPSFYSMIKFSWYSSGLQDERPEFDSVKEVCFTFEKGEMLACSCGLVRFIKCSHCRNIICFPCFFYEYHFH